jgi:cytochrome c oxidase cbb3-type subunit 3
MLVLLLSTPRAFAPAYLQAQQLSTPANGSSDALEGQRMFATSCAACHGLDARGGEHAPDLANKREVQQLSDEALLLIIQDGIAGTGMPAFRSLGGTRIQAVVRHLRNLQGLTPPGKLPGDPERGKTLFFGKPGCSQCHMANGEGGFIGSDLSSFSGPRSADEIRKMITEPDTNLEPRTRQVLVTTLKGKTQTGLVRNEDNFSLQIQTLDGNFHLFTKAELRRIDYQDRSLMPADYGSRLNRQELDDLVSYLISIARNDKNRPVRRD